MALLPMKLPEGGDHVLDVGGRRRVQHDLELEGALGLLGPLPGVGEGLDLGGGLLAGLLPEEDVVAGVGVEGRVEIDEVHGLVGDVVAQDGEVVAVVEGVRHRGGIRAYGGGWRNAGGMGEGKGRRPALCRHPGFPLSRE